MVVIYIKKLQESPFSKKGVVVCVKKLQVAEYLSLLARESELHKGLHKGGFEFLVIVNIKKLREGFRCPRRRIWS